MVLSPREVVRCCVILLCSDSLFFRGMGRGLLVLLLSLLRFGMLVRTRFAFSETGLRGHKADIKEGSKRPSRGPQNYDGDGWNV